MAQTEFVCRNRMSAPALKEQQNDKIHIIENPKSGKLFFVCGSVRGYITKKTQESIDTVDVEDLEYAEVLSSDNSYIPCLFLRGKNNEKRTL